MKTLDQVEPRIQIGPKTTPGDADGVVKITNSGSYYLTGNLYGESNKSGIVIAADNVTIDLCGYSLIGVSNLLHCIRPAGLRQNITIRNGNIIGWGGNAIASYVYGFPFESYLCYRIYEDLVAQDNGAGIFAGPSSSVFRCVARRNRGTGISLSSNSGVCKDRVADSNTDDGITCAEGVVATHCSAQGNTGVSIYYCNGQQTIIGCTVRYNNGGGIRATRALIRDCTIDGNTGYEVQTVFACVIEGCNIGATSGAGISGESVGGTGKSRIFGNNIHNNNIGILLINKPGICIYGNTLHNTINLNVSTGNLASVSTNPATAGPWHNVAL